MLIKNEPRIASSEITDRALYLRRREFLKGSALALGAASSASVLAACGAPEEAEAAPSRIASPVRSLEFKNAQSPFVVDEELTEKSDAQSYNNFYELGLDKGDPVRNADRLKTEPWSVVVDGEVGKPGKIGLEDLLRPHPLEERVYRLRCVEAWSMVIPWIGVPLGDVLARFEPTSNARYVAFETIVDKENLPGQRRAVLDWPYREGLRIDEAMHPLSLLAVGMYGETLPGQNGAPLRLVVPWKYGFKSIKSIVGIRFQKEMPYTSWSDSAPREYGFFANVNPEVDHPRWSQSRERRIGEWRKRPTLPFNGYADEVAPLYAGLDLRKNF